VASLIPTIGRRSCSSENPERLEVSENLGRVLVAIRRRFREGLQDRAFQRLGRIGRHNPQRRRVALQDPVDDLARLRALEWRAPREPLVEQHSQTEDVGSSIHFSSADLLGRGVSDVAKVASHVVPRRWNGLLRQSQVEELYDAVGRTMTFSGFTSR
jgi:hypothetical protein